jgi:hypothetical protein
MDDRRFDALTRVLGAVTDRRGGVRAAIGAAFGLAAGGSALAKESGKGKDKGNGKSGVRAAGEVQPQGPCKSTRRKDNICTADGECCSKFCDKGKGTTTKDSKGRCRCKNRNDECNLDINCCKRGGQQMSCNKGRCSELIPTTMSCKVGGWACKDSLATCTSYIAGVPYGLYCLFGVNQQCTNDAQCTTGFCSNGICKYQLTEICGTAGANTCGDRRASCTTYRVGSDVSARCLLPEGQSCGANAECVTSACVGGFCVEGVPTSVSCLGDPKDFCANPDAYCSTYNNLINGQGTYCLLEDGYECTEDAECLNAYCDAGTCQTCGLGQTGESCDVDSDCCDGFCSVIEGSGRCIGKKTVWAHLTWTTTPHPDTTKATFDTWIWMPQTVPQESADNNQYPDFYNGGDVVSYMANWYPWDTIADPNTEVPDVWVDVDGVSAPGSERAMWFYPVPKGTYRYAIKNWGLCQSDNGSTTSCGMTGSTDDWSGIDDSYAPFSNPSYDTQVIFYEYNKQIRKFVLPWGVTSSHYYWWQVTDLTFDENGWFKEFTTASSSVNGIIRDCAPALYPGNVGGETSNICPYTN